MSRLTDAVEAAARVDVDRTGDQELRITARLEQARRIMEAADLWSVSVEWSPVVNIETGLPSRDAGWRPYQIRRSADITVHRFDSPYGWFLVLDRFTLLKFLDYFLADDAETK